MTVWWAGLACSVSGKWRGARAVAHRRCGRQRTVPARLPQLGVGAAIHAAGRPAPGTRSAAAGRHAA